MIENKFLIVTPAYNTASYIDKCIMSVLGQTYRNFEYIIVDDCSTDGTTEIIKTLFKKHQNFRVHRNITRTASPLQNFVVGIQLSPGDREDIIITMDGDDWFYSNDVLEYLNGVYQDSNLWLTYGQFTSVSGRWENYCKPLKDSRNYRKYGTWVTSHPRTIKRKLFDKINNNDLRDKNGRYYDHYNDAAYMFPAVEMAGLKHSKFINEILYVYNDLNPLGTLTIGDSYSSIIAEIRGKKSYNELTEL